MLEIICSNKFRGHGYAIKYICPYTPIYFHKICGKHVIRGHNYLAVTVTEYRRSACSECDDKGYLG